MTAVLKALDFVPGWLYAVVLGIAIVLVLSLKLQVSMLQSEARAQATQIGALRTERDNARGAASACSDAVDDLRELADMRAVQAQAAQAAAAAAAHGHNTRADTILSTPPTVPGNDCRSAQDRVRAWIRSRAAQ